MVPSPLRLLAAAARGAVLSAYKAESSRSGLLLSFRWLFAGIGAAVALLTCTVSQFAPTDDYQLNPSLIHHSGGFAFAVALPARDDLLYEARSDDEECPDGSQLELFEDGERLGPRHAIHEEIRERGAGRYSHWNKQLWFSASDSSDPRTNGRTYIAQAKKSVRPAWIVVGVLGGSAAMLVLLYSAVTGLASLPFNSRVWAVFRRIALSARPVEPSRAVSLASVAVGAFAGGLATVLGWYFGDLTTTGLGVVRYFPVSDALGYHSCATSIGASGYLGEPAGGIWCSRRAIYPSMLAGLLSLSGWNSQLALVLQGVLVGASIAALGLVFARVFSLLIALLSVGILSVYAWEFVLGLYMTEVPGFVLGLTGWALLLTYCTGGTGRQMASGVGVISVGLAARAGSLSVLPALVAWCAMTTRGMRASQRAGLVAATAIAAAIGPILQVVLVLALGADLSNSGGNFSTSLYSLSTGSRDWREAYGDFAPLFAQTSEAEAFRHVYSVAVKNIVERPEVFMGALAAAGRVYITTLFDFGALAPYGALLSAIAMLGIARCCLTFRAALSSLALLTGLAELLVAPLIIDSGGTRVFAATVGVRVLFLAIGAQWLVGLLDTRSGAITVHSSLSGVGRWTSWPASAIAAFVLLLAVLPITPVGRVMQLKAVQGYGNCPSGQVEVVTRIGRETQSLAVSDDSTNVHSVIPFDVGLGRLRADTRTASSWFGKDFLELTPPITILRAVDLASPDSAAIKPLYFRGVLGDRPTPQSLCVDGSAYVDLAGVRHLEIKSVQPITVENAD